jgi:hypothetical protein
VYSLGLNNDPCILFTLYVKSLWRFKQGDYQYKMPRTGFHSVAKFRAQIRNTVVADSGVFQADCHKKTCRTVHCYSQRPEFEIGMPQS